MRWTCIILYLFACSDDSTFPVGEVPPQPATPTTSSAVVTFALDSIILGEVDGILEGRNAFGYDLDGLTTTATSADVCTRQGNALNDASFQVDGPGGIDNAWSAKIVPIIASMLAAGDTLSENTTRDEVISGLWTLQVQTSGLSG